MTLLHFQIGADCYYAHGSDGRRYEIGDWGHGKWCLTGCGALQAHDTLHGAKAAAEAHEAAARGVA